MTPELLKIRENVWELMKLRTEELEKSVPEHYDLLGMGDYLKRNRVLRTDIEVIGNLIEIFNEAEAL